MNIYELIKAWYEFKAENKKITSTHTELFFYIIDLNNRLAWKEFFGLPSIETCDFLNISYNTFRKVFNELVELNVIKLVKRSQNQYTANQISISVACQNLLGQTKGDYRAFVKAQQKQAQTACDIDIHKYNNTIIQLTEEKEKNELLLKEIEVLKKMTLKKRKKELPIFKNLDIENALSFYEKEIAVLNGHERAKDYRLLKDYLFGKNALNEPLRNVLSLPKQLSFDQFLKVLEKKPENKKLGDNYLMQMENTDKYTKNRKSLYAILIKWFEMDNKN